MRELRKLQCERAVRNEIYEPDTALAGLADMRRAIFTYKTLKRQSQNELHAQLMAYANAPLPGETHVTTAKAARSSKVES